MRPELASAPLETSPSPPARSERRSTSHRMSPPKKMGAVVASGRYAPTAKLRLRTPSSSTTHTMNTPNSTSPQGRFWFRMPLTTVLISTACGAGKFAEPTPGDSRNAMRFASD